MAQRVKRDVQTALNCFNLAKTAEDAQRTREQDDLACQVAENLWTDDMKRARAADTVAGVPIPARPMLSIPMLDQPIQLVLNQERNAHLGIDVHPLSEDADDDTAEVFRGLYRSIERMSRANLARTWAFDRAVKAGRGWYRILTEYDPYGGDPADQRIIIKRILNQGTVYADPFAMEPDWSDGRWLIIVEDIPIAQYRERYPDSSVAAMDDAELISKGSELPGWVNGDDEASRSVRVGEYWYYEGLNVQTRKVCRFTFNAFEILPDTSDDPDDDADESAESYETDTESDGDRVWAGHWIPFVFVPGRELQPWNGERRWVGIIGPNKEAARLYNYSASGAVEGASTEPKAPFDVDPEEIEGYEAWWQQANIRNFPYLPRRKWLHGQLMPPPARIQADGSKMQINLALLQQAADFIHSGTGAFEPTLGQDSSRAESGRAVLALQQQHDAGTSNWLDNLVSIAMMHEARIVLDLIPAIYDRPGRIVQILDLEDNPKKVMLNQPFMPGPNGRPMPAPPMAPQQSVKHYDLSKGAYGVSVSVGKAYQSRIDQGASELGDLFQANPALFNILGDIYLKFRDFPGHTEAAERVKKMLPPPLQPQEGDPTAQLGQMQAQMQQMGQQLQAAEQYIKTEQAKYQAEMARVQLEQAAKVEIERMKAATSISVAEINARAKGVVSANETEMEAIALHQQMQHDAAENEHDRRHDMAMGVMGAAQAAQIAQQPPEMPQEPMA